MARRDVSAWTEWLMSAVSITALVVMLALMGVQSARALSGLRDSQARRYVDVMRGDLMALAERQILHFLDTDRFAGSPADLSFEASDGVALQVGRTEAGWYATAGHEALGAGQGCSVFFGAPPPADTYPSTPAPGEVVCTE